MAVRVVTIFSGIILARILDPSDYGIVALAYVVLGTLNLFTGFGLGGAIIQHQGDRRAAARQAFVVTSAAGAVLTGAVLAVSEISATLLGNAQVAPVLRWLAPVAFLGNLAIVPEALLQKDLRFGKASIAVMSAEIVNIGLALILAASGYGLWSLVFGALSRGIVYNALLWLFNPQREWLGRGPWDGPMMRGLLRFGISSMGGGVITFIYSSADSFIVGRWLGASALGFYSKAYDFTSRTVDSINNVIGSVLMPSYAVIQSEPERLSRAYLKSLRLVALVTVPVATGMLITASELIAALLGEKWLPMVGPFQVLAAVSVVKPLSATTSALFMSMGKPVRNLRAGIVVLLVMIPSIMGLLGLGTTGVALAVLLAHLAGFAFNLHQVGGLLPGTAARMIPAVAPALAASAIMVGCVWASKIPLQMLTGGGTTLLSALLMVGVGAVVYGTAAFLLQGPLLREVFGVIRLRRRAA